MTLLRPLALTCALAACLLGLLAGCDTAAENSLFDPERPARPSPVVAGVEPSGSALAGVEVITITGENFSDQLADNFVYFDNVRGTVLEASPIQLRVRTPNTPRPELRLRVMVLGAREYSNTVTYRLEPPAVRFGNLARPEEPFGLTTDAEGNVYTMLVAEGVAAGIQRFTPGGARSLYFSTAFTWSDLAFGPDGVLYGVRGVRAVFRLPGGGTQQTAYTLPAGAVLNALRFGPDGVLWTASSTGAVYSVDAGGTIREFAVQGAIQDIALYGGHLYAAVVLDGAGRIVRLPITQEATLGAPEPFADLPGAVQPRSVAFAADGHLLVGTDRTPSMLEITPGGEVAPYYPGTLTAPVRRLAWGPGTALYALDRVTGDQESLARVRIDIVEIETRREGA